MTATETVPYTDQLLAPTELQERLRQQSFNRADAEIKHGNAINNHHDARVALLEEYRHELVAQSSPPALLDELRAGGFLWSDVAKVVGVSDTAVRKWRAGGSIEEQHLRRLALLVALSRLYAGQVPHGTFAERMQSRLVESFSATPLQILTLGRDEPVGHLQPLLDWMLDYDDGEAAEKVLDRYLGRDWRQTAQAEQRFRIVTNADGERILVIDG